MVPLKTCDSFHWFSSQEGGRKDMISWKETSTFLGMYFLAENACFLYLFFLVLLMASQALTWGTLQKWELPQGFGEP